MWLIVLVVLVIAGLVGMHAVGPAPTPAAAPQAAAASHVAHGPAPAAGHPAAFGPLDEALTLEAVKHAFQDTTVELDQHTITTTRETE